MPRRLRVIIPGIAHHIVQRGNNRQFILEQEEDFSTYCYLIGKYTDKYDVAVLAYCLMNNHVHFIMVPKDVSGISHLFNTVHMRYAQYKNYKRGTSGHLWQGRFFSCVLGGDHLFKAIRYVEQNPVRAGMVRLPWEYQWSSAKWHVGRPTKKFIKLENCSIVDRKYWKQYLLSADNRTDDVIRRKTQKGKAFASEEFISYWEDKLQCVLRELKPGRRKKLIQEIGR